MKVFDELTDIEIQNCICGAGMTVELVRTIIKESKSLVKENYIDTELFSKVFIKKLDIVMPENLKSYGDWACGYITADNINELMNPIIKNEN